MALTKELHRANSFLTDPWLVTKIPSILQNQWFITVFKPPPQIIPITSKINPYPTAFPYGNGMVLHFYQQQESSTTKTVHKVINRGLKTYV